LHLRNAPTSLLKNLGYGADYQYPHDDPDAFVGDENLPEALRGRQFYEPSERGAEKEIGARLAAWRKRRAEAAGGGDAG
jgi:putative ATPase